MAKKTLMLVGDRRMDISVCPVGQECPTYDIPIPHCHFAGLRGMRRVE